MLTVLSTYLLDETNNARIAAAIEGLGGRFIPAPRMLEARIAQLEEHIADAEILLGGRLTEAQAERAERLRWINVPWAGVNNLVGLDVLRQRGVTVTNSSGAAIAGRARAFGMRVVAMRRDVSVVPSELDRLYAPSELKMLLAGSDVVVVALPLNDATRGLIGAEELAAMRPGACLINIARGPIVRQAELIDALQRGVIAGAALDVFEEEPLPADSPLWSMPNVIVTPHTSGGYAGFWDAVVDLFLDNLERFREGGPMRNLVDLSRGY